jgi:cytochrome P450
MNRARLPPGPRWTPPGGLLGPWRDPLGRFERYRDTYGDSVHLRIGGEHMFLLSHPRDIRDVLVTHQANFTKSRGLERAKQLLGEGLLTAEGEAHRRQRRLLQPAFHRDRIAQYAGAMVELADTTRQLWVEGTVFDVSRAMMRLTLAIVGRTLFSADVETRADEIGAALTRVLETFWIALLPFGDTIQRLPIPALTRARRARGALDAVIYRMIAERRTDGIDRGDVLSMLLLARDVDEGGDGRGLSDRQVRDEAMTLMLAGHETTANALAWTWYLLARSPEVRQEMHDEIDRVLGRRLPTAADVPALGFVTKVITESMRMYPPVWLIGRRAKQTYGVGDYTLPPRSIAIMSPWVVHRDPRWYPEPGRFLPRRWTPEFVAGLPRQAYFPFGAGSRQCIGESFAWMELVLLVATIAQQWEFDLVPGHRVRPQPLVTLRAKDGVRVVAKKRMG